MLKKLITAAGAASLLALSSVSFAQPTDRHDIRHDRREMRHDRHELRHDRRDLRHDRRHARHERREHRVAHR